MRHLSRSVRDTQRGPGRSPAPSGPRDHGRLGRLVPSGLLVAVRLFLVLATPLDRDERRGAFLLAAGLTSIGAGNIAATALLAPVALSIAGDLRISAFLMTLMLANGANAAAFSPIAPTGIIAQDQHSPHRFASVGRGQEVVDLDGATSNGGNWRIWHGVHSARHQDYHHQYHTSQVGGFAIVAGNDTEG